MNFYLPGNVWFLFLLVPLILFYFLKLRRPELKIPSLVLWRRVMNDTRVNSPFQRFRKNILLLIQALLLLLLILGAMQPYWRGESAKVKRIPVLIDCSASMGALSGQGGVSCLEIAKKRVREIVAGLLPDQEVCIVSFGRTARKRTGFTNDKRLLLDALQQIEVEEVQSEIEDALRMVQALGQSAPFDEVLLTSDGNFPPRVSFELPFKLNFERVPQSGSNFGITALHASRSSSGYWDVFVIVEGSQKAQNTATLELIRDAEVIGREHLTLTSGQARQMLFQVPAKEAAFLTVKLALDGFDSLQSDNIAFLSLPTMRPLSCYVAGSMVSCSRALQGMEGIDIRLDSVPAAAGTGYDLVVTDRVQDLSIEGKTCLYTGIVPPDLQKLVSVERGGSEVVDWSGSSPLLRHVEWSDVAMLDQPRTAEGVSEIDLENLGYEVLVHGNRGPLLLEKKEGEKISFYLLFHCDRSTLPYRVGFPVLMHNLVQIALHQAGLAEARAAQTGVLPPLKLLPQQSYSVSGPNSTRHEKTDDRGVLAGLPATSVGEYVVSLAGAEQMRIGASLLSSSETFLSYTEEIHFNELSVRTAPVSVRTDQSLWRYFALLAFCLLLLEWWFFHKPLRSWK
jgi:hypothetical protein